jgi:hypothetical protein
MVKKYTKSTKKTKAKPKHKQKQKQKQNQKQSVVVNVNVPIRKNKPTAKQSAAQAPMTKREFIETLPISRQTMYSIYDDPYNNINKNNFSGKANQKSNARYAVDPESFPFSSELASVNSDASALTDNSMYFADANVNNDSIDSLRNSSYPYPSEMMSLSSVDDSEGRAASPYASDISNASTGHFAGANVDNTSIDASLMAQNSPFKHLTRDAEPDIEDIYTNFTENFKKEEDPRRINDRYGVTVGDRFFCDCGSNVKNTRGARDQHNLTDKHRSFIMHR